MKHSISSTTIVLNEMYQIDLPCNHWHVSSELHVHSNRSSNPRHLSVRPIQIFPSATLCNCPATKWRYQKSPRFSCFICVIFLRTIHQSMEHASLYSLREIQYVVLREFLFHEKVCKTLVALLHLSLNTSRSFSQVQLASATVTFLFKPLLRIRLIFYCLQRKTIISCVQLRFWITKPVEWKLQRLPVSRTKVLWMVTNLYSTSQGIYLTIRRGE